MDYSKERLKEKQRLEKLKPNKGDYRNSSQAPGGKTPLGGQRVKTSGTPQPRQSGTSAQPASHSRPASQRRPASSGQRYNTPPQSSSGGGRTANGGDARVQSQRPPASSGQRYNGQRASASSGQRYNGQRASASGVQRTSSQRDPGAVSRRRPVTAGGSPTPPQKRRKGIGAGVRRFLIGLVIIVVAAVAVGLWMLTNNLNPNIAAEASKYNISSEAASVAQSHRIVNIVIFGTDGRADVDGERSDSTMIASLDFEHGSIKISSLMRDTYVSIPGNGFDKLNAAYSLGGADLALQTINQNFDTAITDYVSVNFECMVEMVNAVGGVNVDISSDDELYWLNQYLMDVNDKVGSASPDVAGTGTQLLDGSQALAYCRIRYIGNGDFDRTQRQRTVFEQVLNKAMALNPVQQYNLLQKIMPYVKTSMDTNEILKYAANVALMRNRTIQQKQIPTDEYVQTGDLDGVSYVFPVTLDDNIKALYNFIYQIDYTPSTDAQYISKKIQNVWQY